MSSGRNGKSSLFSALKEEYSKERVGQKQYVTQPWQSVQQWS